MENFTVLKPFSLRGLEVEKDQQIKLAPFEATQCLKLGLVKPSEAAASAEAPKALPEHKPKK